MNTKDLEALREEAKWTALSAELREDKATAKCIRRQQAAIQELAKDSERLDYLARNIQIGSSAGGLERWVIDLADPGVELDTGKVFFAAIDSAIASQEQTK